MKMNFMVRTKDQRVETTSKRRFLPYVRTINWQNAIPVYLRVSYGRQVDGHGKSQAMYNDGIYTNKQEFDMALKAFMEG